MVLRGLATGLTSEKGRQGDQGNDADASQGASSFGREERKSAHGEPIVGGGKKGGQGSGACWTASLDAPARWA